ncbi:hypothetical protein BBJ28_00011181 [Nothophytophthora sp. Chile5]|nr:hypothetical protein BBJ28_00011181 [Nothophytophthora sp. Chile5]
MDLSVLIDRLADREAASAAPPRLQATKAVANVSASQLPPLELQLLQRPRLVLDLNGNPSVAMDQLVRLHEYQEPATPVNALQLTALPKKCLSGDEVALMPCHSMKHRGFALLAAERWREPLRDRDKRWAQDELPFLLRGGFQQIQATSWSMTRPPAANNRGKWTRNETNRLHVLPRHDSASLDGPASPTKPLKRPPRVLLRSQGALISRSYCVVSVFGEGIYGRLYGAGLNGKDKHRSLHVEAYESASSRTFTLRVSLEDLEWLFRVGGDDPERSALLAPGRKQELLRQLIALLFFQYPDDLADEETDAVAPSTAQRTGLPVLRLSPELQLNEAALRRLEREEQLRQEEARRLEALAALMAKPRRSRHRVLCQPLRLRGRSFFVSVHHFPAQARNFVVSAYCPSASATYKLTVGLLEASTLVRLYPLPRNGFSTEQTQALARQLLPRLRLCGREDDRPNARMTLAIAGGRQGPAMAVLPPLLPMQTEEKQREELLAKMQRDAERSLQFELLKAQRLLRQEAETEHARIRQLIAELDAKRIEILEKDQTLKTQIGEIDALGGGSGANAELKQQHEARRGHKATRQTLKLELKAVVAQISALKAKRQIASDRETDAVERAQGRTNQARKRIREEAQRSLAAALPVVASTKPQKLAGQRTWLARTHMRSGRMLLASGGCRLTGKRLRFSLFAVEDEIDATSEPADADYNLILLELYDPVNCSCSLPLLLSRLEWLAFTKQQHEQQQLIPDLTPNMTKRLVELRGSVEETRQALYLLTNATSTASTTTSKTKSSKTKPPSTRTKRLALQHAMAEASGELSRLHREAPWPGLVRGLCERLTVISTDSTAFEVHVDRCIFRAVSAVLCVANEDGDGGDDGEPSVVYCRVRAEVLALTQAVVFDVLDPLEGQQWRVEYPESRELLREFAVESFAEQQLHLEAIMTSLLLQSNVATGRLELRFEE